MEYYNKILHWITTLKEVKDVYEGKTIDNIITQLETIKKELGQAIEIIPGKSERWLMISIEPDSRMYFHGDNSKMAFVKR